jgi:hypothetical protein
MTDHWDSARCNFEPAGAGFGSVARWFGIDSPTPSPTEAELLRRLSSELESHPKIDLLISHKGGMGDTLMCSTVAFELRRRGVKNVWLETRWPEDFAGQPEFDGVLPESYESEWLAEKLGGRVLYPAYASAAPGEDREIAPNGHILAEMCRRSGILGEVSIRPYFTVDETHAPPLPDEYIAIAGVGGHAVQTKNWYDDRFQSLSRLLETKLPLVQLGSAADRRLDGALDLRGKTDIRQAAAVLRRARCFVGEVGGLMHLARAVDCPSVVIFGGREAPRQSGYSANLNIVGRVDCSPCWIIKNCPNHMACMDNIRPESVASEVLGLLSRGVPRPLLTDKLVVH